MKDEALAFDAIAALICLGAWWGFSELEKAQKGGKSFFDKWLRK